jgi:hypothetical protein
MNFCEHTLEAKNEVIRINAFQNLARISFFVELEFQMIIIYEKNNTHHIIQVNMSIFTFVSVYKTLVIRNSSFKN